jgi:hypothetical protein
VTDERFRRAIALIDAANAEDPNLVDVGGELRPRELVHAEMMTGWVRRLAPDASEAVLLAARAQHIRRWQHPRSTFPQGRGGYLRWRTSLYRFHAEEASRLLSEAGYDGAMIDRVARIVLKEGLGRDAEVQLIEDALCLVFLEPQLDELAGRLDHVKMVDILRKTWRKMSPAARDQALALAPGFSPADQQLIREALT